MPPEAAFFYPLGEFFGLTGVGGHAGRLRSAGSGVLKYLSLFYAVSKLGMGFGGRPASWASVRDAVATYHILTVVVTTDSGATMRIRKASAAESELRELYRLLGVGENIIPAKTV